MASADRPTADHFEPGRQNLMPHSGNRLTGEVTFRAGQNRHAVARSDERLAEFNVASAAGVVGANKKLVEEQNVHAALERAGHKPSWPCRGLEARPG